LHVLTNYIISRILTIVETTGFDKKFFSRKMGVIDYENLVFGLKNAFSPL